MPTTTRILILGIAILSARTAATAADAQAIAADSAMTISEADGAAGIGSSVPADVPTVELVTGGDAPRKQLRYKPRVGSEQTITIKVNNTQTTAMPGMGSRGRSSRH